MGTHTKTGLPSRSIPTSGSISSRRLTPTPRVSAPEAASLIDRTFWEVLCVDHLHLLINCFRWAARGEMPVSVKGPGVLDIAVWEQENSLTVHLVNLTNPMMMKGPYRELIPIGKQIVRLSLRQGRRPSRAQLLVKGETIPFEVRVRFAHARPLYPGSRGHSSRFQRLEDRILQRHPKEPKVRDGDGRHLG